MLQVVFACLVLHRAVGFFGGGGLTAMDMMRMQGGFGGMEPPAPPTYDQLYTEAVEAYSDEKWEEAIRLMERALTDYRSVEEGLVQCKKQCVESKSSDPAYPKEFSSDLEFQYFHSLLTYAACVKKCKRRMFGNRVWADISEEVNEAFETKNTYNYLQLCYYKTGSLSKAARAASTFLYFNPDDEMGNNNIKFYGSLGLNESDFKPLESMDYMDAYEKGVKFYDKEDWEAAIEAFEEAVRLYLPKYTECRLVCEGRAVERTPDLATMLSANVQSLLQCRQDCSYKLATNTKKMILEDFFERHYHYLQFAYYKVGNLKKAAECAATYLLYHPEDEVMLGNIKHYKEMEGLSEEDFVPRQEIAAKQQVEEAEQKLLHVIYGEPEEDEFRRQMELDDSSFTDFPPPPPPDEQSDETLSVPVGMPEAGTTTGSPADGQQPPDKEQAVPEEKPPKGETAADEIEEKGQREKTRKDHIEL